MQQFSRVLMVLVFAGCVFLSACGGGASPETAAAALKPFTADLEKLIADTKTALVPISQLPEARGDDAAACTAVMADKLKAYTQYTTFGASHLDGTLFCTSQPQTTPANILERAYFQRVLQTKDLSVGDYQVGKVTNKKSVGIGYPILDGSNAVQGVVLSPVDLDWLNEHLAAMSLPANAEVVLVDSKGNVLARAPYAEEMVGKPIGESPLGKALLAQIDGSGEFAGTDGVTRIYAYTAPQGSGKNWIVALGLKK